MGSLIEERDTLILGTLRREEEGYTTEAARASPCSLAKRGTPSRIQLLLQGRRHAATRSRPCTLSPRGHNPTAGGTTGTPIRLIWPLRLQ